MNEVMEIDDVEDDQPVRRKPGRKPAPAKSEIKSAISADLMRVSMTMKWWRLKHPDRARIHALMDEIKDLGFLHPIERKTLLYYCLRIVEQSVALDGECASDVLAAKAGYDLVQLPAVPGKQKGPNESP